MEEMINVSNEIEEIEEFQPEAGSEMSVGGAMLLGAAFTAVGIGIAKLVKKGIEHFKAKKEQRKAEADVVIEQNGEQTK